MFEIFALLFGCTLLAAYIEQFFQNRIAEGHELNRTYGYGSVGLFLLLLVMVWFLGTRTTMNDTITYIGHFKNDYQGSISELKRIDWGLGANPLFNVYIVVLKTFVTQNEYLFVYITSAITIIPMVWFLYRYAWSFRGSLYLFIATTAFAFTAAAMKQALATAIAIWSIPLIGKKKYFRAILLLISAALIHAYVLVISLALVLYGEKVWGRKILIIILITTIICLTFSSSIEQAIKLVSYFGDDYKLEWFSENTGVGIMRILASLMLPFFAFLYRDKIREKGLPFFDLCINMSIVSTCITVTSGFGGAVLMGRVPYYFGVFRCIAFPYILFKGRDDQNNSFPWAMLVYTSFILYYFTYYNKYFEAWNIGMWGSVYYRFPLFRMLFGG